jgi:hypothetical protein
MNRKAVRSERYIVEQTLQICAGVLEEETGSRAVVAKLFESAAARLRKPKSAPGVMALRSYEVEIGAADVIRDWHGLPEYVDQVGAPLPLDLFGAEGSIESIARRRTNSLEKVREWIALLKTLKAIRKTSAGKFLPTNYTMMVAESREAMERRGIKILSALVGTLNHNLSEPDPTKREFERSSHVLRVKSAEIPAFRKFLSAQGREFIRAIDAWLEARRLDETAEDDRECVEVLVEVLSNVRPHSSDVAKPKVTKAAARV